MKLYAERDIMEQGQVYCDHVNQMTAEGLHAKSDIAAELAHRGIEIARLTQLFADTSGDLNQVEAENNWAVAVLRRVAEDERVPNEYRKEIDDAIGQFRAAVPQTEGRK